MIFYTYDLEGNLIEIEAEPVFTSLERSPGLTVFPDNLMGIMCAIPAKDGKPRLAKLPLSLFGTGKDMTKALADLLKKPDWFDLGQVVLNEKTVPARGPGVSSLDVACANAKVGDQFVITPVGKLPAGYMIGAITCGVDGTIQVPVFHPDQAAQTEYNFTCKVTAFRAPVIA
jgi:hypothetical protein